MQQEPLLCASEGCIPPGQPQLSAQATRASLSDVLDAMTTHHLQKEDCLALLHTSKGSAERVIQHSAGVTVAPTAVLQHDSSRRATVLRFAAGNRNIHLRLADHPLPLDTPAVWPGVTTLSLSNVSLSSSHIRDLHLQQLSNLHTLRLEWDETCDVNIDKLQRIVQHGGLSALQSLHTVNRSWDASTEAALLLQLVTLLQDRVTQLHVTCLNDAAGFAKWTNLQKLHVDMRMGLNHQQFQMLRAHGQLQHVTLPATSLLDIRDYSSQSWNLATLTLTGRTYTNILAHLPLSGVRCLRVGEVFMHWKLNKTEAAVDNLHRCGSIELKPRAWQDFHSLTGSYKGINTWGHYHTLAQHKRLMLWLSRNPPTVKLPFHLGLLSTLLRNSQQLCGALIIQFERPVAASGGPSGEPAVWGMLPHISHADLKAFNQIPPGIHTLCLRDWHLGYGHGEVEWEDVRRHLPPTVEHVIVVSPYRTFVQHQMVVNDCCWRYSNLAGHQWMEPIHVSEWP